MSTKATESGRSNNRAAEKKPNYDERTGDWVLFQKSPKSISMVSRTRAWKSPFPFTPPLDGLCADASPSLEGCVRDSGAGDAPGFGVVDLGMISEINKILDRGRAPNNIPRRKQARNSAQPRAGVKGRRRTEPALAALPLRLLELRAADCLKVRLAITLVYLREQCAGVLGRISRCGGTLDGQNGKLRVEVADLFLVITSHG